MELLRIFLGNLSEELKEAANDEVLDLFEECTRLQCLARYVQREILS